MYYYDDFPAYFKRQQTPFGGTAMPDYTQPQLTPFMPQGMPGMNGMPTMNGLSGMPGMTALPGTIPLPTLPSGVPTGPQTAPIPGVPLLPGNVTGTWGGPTTTLDNTQFVPGYLKTQIGKPVRVEFLIGSTGPLVDRIGTLIGVGTSYILIQPVESDDVLLCDLYSIKFVTFLL